jgi:hypothetical protein
MKDQFKKYSMMMTTLTTSFPEMRDTLKNTWDKMTMLDEEPEVEFFHRIIDGNSRVTVDVKYNSMKEIVENVYYRIIPQDNVQHYLVKKCKSQENSLLLKCRGMTQNNG